MKAYKQKARVSRLQRRAIIHRKNAYDLNRAREHGLTVSDYRDKLNSLLHKTSKHEGKLKDIADKAISDFHAGIAIKFPAEPE